MKFKIKEHKIDVSASGTEFKINSYEYLNNPGGKIYYIQAGIHGVEIAGIPVIYELINFIEQNNCKINIICVPISNPFGLDSQIMGLQTGYNNIHTNFQNCYNYNRLGQGIGTTFENNIIKKLYEISKKADIIIDLHSSGFESEEHIYTHKKFSEKIKNFGINNILLWENPGLSFEDTNIAIGKEAYTLELGASRSVEKNRIQKYLNNILGFLKLKEIKKLEKYNIWNSGKDFFHMDSEFSGILVWEKSVGDYIKTGELIAKVYMKNNEIGEIISNSNYYFLIKNPIHAPYTGQEIAQFLKVN